jgi:hypothetical protein
MEKLYDNKNMNIADFRQYTKMLRKKIWFEAGKTFAFSTKNA